MFAITGTFSVFAYLRCAQSVRSCGSRLVASKSMEPRTRDSKKTRELGLQHDMIP